MWAILKSIAVEKNGAVAQGRGACFRGSCMPPLTQRVRAPESVEEITRNVDLLCTPLSYDMQ